MKKVILSAFCVVVLAGCTQVLNPAEGPDSRSLQAVGHGVNGPDVSDPDLSGADLSGPDPLDPGPSGKAHKLTAKPFVYDPDHTHIIVSAWRPHTGLPDTRGRSDFGLVLQKNGPTSTNAAAGAVIKGAKGETLTELGFDYNATGHCGAGSPRFNVTIGDKLYFFGCAYGTHTDLGNGWVQVRFSDKDAYPQVGGTPGGAFGGVIKSITIIADEGTDITGQGTPGQSVIDNIDVNGTLIGKPGKSR